MRADAGEYGGKVPSELLQGNAFSHRAITLQFDSEIENAADFRIENFTRQAEFRDAVAQHAPGLVQGFENRDRISSPNQLIGAGQARRAGANNGDFFYARPNREPWEPELMGDTKISYHALNRVEGHWAILGATVARRLARVRANAACDRGERIAFDDPVPDPFECLLASEAVVFRFRDAYHQLADFAAVGTSRGAGRRLRDKTRTQRADLACARHHASNDRFPDFLEQPHQPASSQGEDWRRRFSTERAPTVHTSALRA